jgi:hypothetical protein
MKTTDPSQLELALVFDGSDRLPASLDGGQTSLASASNSANVVYLSFQVRSNNSEAVTKAALYKQIIDSVRHLSS